MQPGRQRNLKLNRQTIRALTTQEMSMVAGGAAGVAAVISKACVPTDKNCIPVSERCPTGPIGCPAPAIRTAIGGARL